MVAARHFFILPFFTSLHRGPNACVVIASASCVRALISETTHLLTSLKQTHTLHNRHSQPKDKLIGAWAEP